MQITPINTTNNNLNKTHHSNNFKAKVIFQLSTTSKAVATMSLAQYRDYRLYYSKTSLNDGRAYLSRAIESYFLTRMPAERLRQMITIKKPWIPNCLKMLNEAYQNLTLNEKKEVVGLLNELYNFACDKEIVYDINNNHFFVFPKDSVKNFEEKSIQPDKLYGLVVLPNDMSFTKHGSDDKLHSNVNIKSLFELILNEMKKINGMFSSITVENSNKIQVENNKIPPSILDHEVFDCFNDIPDYLYDMNSFRQYFRSKRSISLGTNLVNGRDYLFDSGVYYIRIPDSYVPSS